VADLSLPEIYELRYSQMVERLQQGCFARPGEVGVKNVEAQAHRAINYDSFLGVFAHLGIQRDDEHLSLCLWCPTSKPIFDLPSAMNTSTKIGDDAPAHSDFRYTLVDEPKAP
jgi:hypothetical protein